MTIPIAEARRLFGKLGTSIKEKDRTRMWHPAEGTNRIRLLPNPSDKDQFWKEIQVHWIIRDGSPGYVPCVKRNCPLCDEYLRTNNTHIKAQAHTRTLFNIYDYEDNQVKVWVTGKRILEDILGNVYPKYGDISHPTKGRDLEIVKRSENPFVRLEVRALNKSKVRFNEKELYHLNKVASKMFMVKQAKPKKMLRLLRIDTTWK